MIFKVLLRCCSGILLLFVVQTSYASADPSQLAPLAESPQWLALLHVNRGATVHSRGESYVDDPEFFLSQSGKVSPLDELLASVEAMQGARSEARCRYPARFKYLAAALDWPLKGALDHCEEYNAWAEQIPRGRAVLVFPASYLNSPSSMFGQEREPGVRMGVLGGEFWRRRNG